MMHNRKYLPLRLPPCRLRSSTAGGLLGVGFAVRGALNQNPAGAVFRDVPRPPTAPVAVRAPARRSRAKPSAARQRAARLAEHEENRARSGFVHAACAAAFERCHEAARQQSQRLACAGRSGSPVGMASQGPTGPPQLRERQRPAFRAAYASAELGDFSDARDNEALLRDYVLWPDLRAAWEVEASPA